MPKWFYLVIAALSGAAMALQGTLNTALGKIVGIWESTLVVHLVGTAVSIMVLLAAGISITNFSKLGQAPWYLYLGGLLNVAIIYAVVRSMPQIGVSNATTAIIVAQIMTAIFIDAVGAFGMRKIGFQYLDLLGVALLAAGTHILLMD
jgi:transporter family-2 protein